jgi:hypothetical protein
VNGAAHRVAERAVDELMLLDERSPGERRGNDTSLVVILRAGEIDEVDVGLWKCREQKRSDLLGLDHFPISLAHEKASVNARRRHQVNQVSETAYLRHQPMASPATGRPQCTGLAGSLAGSLPPLTIVIFPSKIAVLERATNLPSVGD